MLINIKHGLNTTEPYINMTYTNENSIEDSIPKIDRGRVLEADCFPPSREFLTQYQTAHYTPNRRPVMLKSRDAQSSLVDSGIGNSDSMSKLCQKLDSIGMEDELRQREEGMTNGHQTNGHQTIGENGAQGRTLDAITVYSQDKDGDTLLHTGIILQEQTLVMLFISMAPSYMWLSIKNLLSQTPLILAVLTRQIDVVRRLLVGGADMTSRDRDGNTALHVACREGYTDIAQTLLDPVRYIETKQNNYEIPYQKIPQNLEILNYEGFSCLHLAAAGGHLDIVQLLMKSGADVNAKEAKTGRTILHNACIEGNLVLVRYLLKCRTCNINARTYDDFTPFDLARARDHNDIIIELATAGARYDEDWFVN